jgi:HK97 gp10 family phage protein
VRLTMKVEGLDQALRKVNAMFNALDPRKVELVLLKGAKTVSKESQRRAPRREGTLKKAHKARVSKRRRKDGAGAFSAIDRKIAPHAHLVEYGTVKMKAQPFFRPAVDATEGQVKAQVEGDLKALVDGATR